MSIAWETHFCVVLLTSSMERGEAIEELRHVRASWKLGQVRKQEHGPTMEATSMDEWTAETTNDPAAWVAALRKPMPPLRPGELLASTACL